jgi:two-component system OmpR family response regulator/two-component system response regulator RstA
MAKPLRPRALLARLAVHIRREQPPETESVRAPIVVGDLEIDPMRRTATLAGATIDLTTAEFDLLKLLAENAGQIVSRKDIYEKLHGIKYDGVDRSIDLRISRLRKKLGDEANPPRRVKSVRGVGYLLSPSI